MRAFALAFALIFVMLSGCATEMVAEPVAQIANVTWHGTVQTPAFNAVQGALVTVHHFAVFEDGTRATMEETSTTTTDTAGEFSMSLPPGAWPWNITHPDFEPASGTVVSNGTLEMILIPVSKIVPFQRAYPFDGYIECAAEYLIITPSCDTILRFTGEQAGVDVPSPLRDDSVFEIAFEEDWATAVLDVQFDLADHPGLAGLRVSAYAADADAELFSYERFRQQVSAESFSMRIDPGTDYGDVVPTPSGAGGMRFEFFPHGHGDDTVCTPDGTCFLGVGATFRLEFSALATIFYHEAAPEGWTALA